VLKFLLDESAAWPALQDALGGHGHDAVAVADRWSGAGDEDLLARAHEGGRILVTQDKGFVEFAIRMAHPHAGIVRFEDLERPAEQVKAMLRLVGDHGKELRSGAVLVANGKDGVSVRERPDNGA